MRRLKAISGHDIALFFLLAWAPVSVLSYPFLRVGDPAWLTFDRVWILALGAWVLLDLRHKRPRSRHADLVTLVLACFVVTFGARALLTEEDRLTVMKAWLDAIVLPAILFIAARRLISGMREWRLLIISLATAGGLLAVLGLAEFVFDFELATRSGGTPIFDPAIDMIRVSGPYPLPDIYALSLVICYAATLGWLGMRKTGSWPLPAAIAVLELAAIGITFFRAAWLAALVITVVAVGGRMRSRHRPVAGLAAVLVLAATVLALTRIESVNTRLTDSDNVTGRLATWGQDLNVFATAPVFGVGVERFTSATSEETDVVVSGVAALDQPHSAYLGLLAEQGLVGFLPFALLTVAVFWLVRALGRRASPRASPTSRAAGSFTASGDEDAYGVWACAAGAGLAYLVMALTLTVLPLGPSNSFFALLIGGAASQSDRYRDHLPARIKNRTIAWVSLAILATGVGVAAVVSDLSPEEAPSVDERRLLGELRGTGLNDGTYSELVLSDRPSVYWRFDSTGPRAKDETGMGRDGKYVGDTSISSPGALGIKADTSVALGSLDGRVDSSYKPWANGEARTFEGWAYRDTSSTNDTIFGATGRGGGEPALMRLENGDDVAFYPNASQASVLWDDAWPGDRRWVHWVIVFDEPADTASLYVDGDRVLEQTGQTQTYESERPFSAGAWNGGDYFAGRLDEIAIYDRALGEAAVRRHYLALAAAAPEP